MAIRIDFDSPDLVKAVPGAAGWSGQWASQSPLNAWYIVTDGNGANGSQGYLALPGREADQFYAESTPYWWTPSTTFDLRDTEVSFYLQEIEPITVAPGYRPYVFIDDYIPGGDYCGWYIKQPLTVGQGEWAYNRVILANDESAWVRYSNNRSLDQVLSTVGFIGVMYIKDTACQGVNATGVLGIDKFEYHPR
ncbi:MAG: hypothetical protein EXR62_08770 [Chloroflexi bacterium]|nr:hypothetical protein [Chloroflexota bacterium]